MPRLSPAIVLGSALALLFAPACGTAASTFEGGVYHAPGVAFGVGDVPTSWHRVDVDDAALAFHDEVGSSVLVSARCGTRADDIPLVALTNQLIIGTTEREFMKEEVIPLDRREARHTILRAKLDGVTLVWDVYVMKKNGCVYDVVFVTPPDHFEQGSAAFERFALGLHALGEGS
jgi:hypothetical protein